jgi:hypothetical protein
MTEPQPPHQAAWVAFENKIGRSFEARVPLRCQCCRRTIAPGERFSRLRVESRTYERRPFCRTCRPVAPVGCG